MALQAQVPVVPVAVSGARDAMGRGSILIRPVTVRVQFAPPISTAGLGFADREVLAQQVRAAIAGRLPSSS
jgi:1-acyl-sn-glycerol-3-phosphate acyltransferase